MAKQLFSFGIILLILAGCKVPKGPTTSGPPILTVEEARADSANQLSGAEIATLMNNKTAYSFSYGNSGRTQVGYFSSGKGLKVRTDDFIFEGTWSVEGNLLCYSLAETTLCSFIYRQLRGTMPSRYFSVRDQGNAPGTITAVFTKFENGNVEQL